MKQTNKLHSYLLNSFLQDQNDMTPTFEQNTYTAPRLLETASSGTPVITVKATDGDPEVVEFKLIYCSI